VNPPTIGCDIEAAAALLRAGELVAFPTETVYGLGANATDEQAVRAIFAAKGRPANNPLIVHVASFEALLECTDLEGRADAQRIREALERLRPEWPGPLSVVVPRAAHIAPAVSAGGPSVALRIPRHPLALALLEACALPLAAPSANPSNYISPTTAQHVRESLGDAVAYVLDGGPCAVGIESTVLSLLEDEPVILRPGAVTAEQLGARLGRPVRVAPAPNAPAGTPMLSPGQLARHYAPRTRVVLLDRLAEAAPLPARIGAILFEHHRPLPFAPAMQRVLGETGDLEQVAAGLFAALRALDAAGLDLIVVDTCEPVGIGAAIMDRLLRAAHQA
jgi:L-threonylcarbamoyladenylate synthase